MIPLFKHLKLPFTLHEMQEGVLYYSEDFSIDYTLGDTLLLQDQTLYSWASQLKQEGTPEQQVVFDTETQEVWAFPLQNFQTLRRWLQDPAHFNQWTTYPLTTWSPEDVRTWQTKPLMSWTLSEVFTLLLILETIHHTKELELKQSLSLLLNIISYHEFQTRFKDHTFLSLIDFK